MRPFTDYEVWRVSHALILEVYSATKSFPREEIYGLTSQLRRASASIATNIAEGSARGDREFHQFLRIAHGSAAETEYLLILARDLGFLPPENFEKLHGSIVSIRKMLTNFMRTLAGERQS